MKYLKRFFSKSNNNSRIYLNQIKEDLEDIFVNLMDLGATAHYSDCEETETVLVRIRYPQSGGLSNFHGVHEELKNAISQIKGLGFFVKMEMKDSYCEIDIGEGNGKKRKLHMGSRRRRGPMKK